MSTAHNPHFRHDTELTHAPHRRAGTNGHELTVNDDGEIALRGNDRARPRLPRFGTRGWGVFLCAAYPILAIAPLALLTAFGPDDGHPAVTQLGLGCALVGFTLLCLQFVLTARLPWIEGPFGLDVVLQFHRTMALVIVALLCAHPVLVAGDEGWGLLTRLHAHGYIWAGRLALALLAAQVAAAFLRGRVRLKYETWRRSHNLIAMAILAAGFVHGAMAGDDLHGRVARVLWTALPAVALAVWAYARMVRPLLLARRAFRVTSVRFEAPAVCTLTLAAPAGRPFHFLPGQFQFLRFIRSGMPAEEHPFTIASSPQRTDAIAVTIKDCGDFTGLLDRARTGDLATVHGPFGRFSHDLHADERDLVFIAGGVGITPLMSMLRAMRDRRETRRVTLIYACRGLDDIVFAGELTAMEGGRWPELKVIYVLSEPPAPWAGATGRVDVGRLEAWCDGLDGWAFYLCCPPRMTVDLVRGLRGRGVSARHIHCDYFAL